MQHICDVDEIHPDKGKDILIQQEQGNRYLMLFNRQGTISAYINSCPHQGRSLSWAPDQFLFSPDGLLVCPHHGASFDLDTGICIGGPCQGAALTEVAIVIEQGKVFLG